MQIEQKILIQCMGHISLHNKPSTTMTTLMNEQMNECSNLYMFSYLCVGGGMNDRTIGRV